MKNLSWEAPSSKLKDWIKSHSDVLHNPWAGSYYLVNIKSVHFNRLTIADGFHKPTFGLILCLQIEMNRLIGGY